MKIRNYVANINTYVWQKLFATCSAVIDTPVLNHPYMFFSVHGKICYSFVLDVLACCVRPLPTTVVANQLLTFKERILSLINL